jgi:hypothetical protein
MAAFAFINGLGFLRTATHFVIVIGSHIYGPFPNEKAEEILKIFEEEDSYGNKSDAKKSTCKQSE